MASKKQIEQYEQAMRQIDEMLICPFCGDGLVYYPTSSHDKWVCPTCLGGQDETEWTLYSVAELDSIWQSKQE